MIPGALINCEKEEAAAEHEPHSTTGAEAAAADQARPQRAFDHEASTRAASPIYPRWPARSNKRYRPVVEEDENEDRGSKNIAPANSAPKAEDSDDYCEMVGEPRGISGKSVGSTDGQSRGHSKPPDAGSGASHAHTTLDAQRLSLALKTNKKLEEKVRELREALNEREKELQESNQAIKEREENLMQKAESITRYKRLVEELREEKQELSTKVDKLKDRLMDGN
ncbi:hypothetical protein MPH_08685 [Macrophomina phaseolina MS6]|uniref:Uncharacterized protein n=2 Tax=Macrophomina phaseolina TaxID=35725 RepID=K2RVE7_MACPH|nr:hypothetical protein MPH_08685 [Macrophomina phaseolina MS6]